MSVHGPDLTNLMNHLKKMPKDFLLPLEVVNVQAIGRDLLEELNCQYSKEMQNAIEDLSASGQQLLLYCFWILHHGWFRHNSQAFKVDLLEMSDHIEHLAQLVSLPQFLQEQIRREELVRMVLTHCSVVPKGESDAKAADRWKSISSVIKSQVLNETLEARRRAEEVLEKIRKAQADAAAAKVSRE